MCPEPCQPIPRGRSVFIIGHDKKIKLSITYPASTGRNFDEILRVIDSLQLTANHQVATPVNWKDGDDVIIVPSLSNEEAKQKFPDGWDEQKSYLRVVKQPRDGREHGIFATCSLRSAPAYTSTPAPRSSPRAADLRHYRLSRGSRAPRPKPLRETVDCAAGSWPAECRGAEAYSCTPSTPQRVGREDAVLTAVAA